jgi:heptosyltransferase II
LTSRPLFGHEPRIVVRGTNWVGDTVMSVPAMRELRQIFPSSRISFWAPAGLAPLIQATGVPDEVVTFTSDCGGPLRRPFVMRKSLQRGEFHLAVLFQNAFESAFTAWLAGIPFRAGFPTDLRGPLLNIRVPLDPSVRTKHQVFYYLAVTDYLKRLVLAPTNDRPDVPSCAVNLPDEILERGRRLLQSLDVDSGLPFFCLCPGSVNSEAKRWPADYFARLADLIAEVFNGVAVFLGAPEEHGLIEGIVAETRSSKCVNLAGRTDMLLSMAIMRLSTMVVSNDTGSAHLAVAAGSRVLTVFGPTSAGATAPYGSTAYVIQGHAPCAPCRHFRCPVPGHPCMRGVLPDTVVQEVRGILREGTASHRCVSR